MTYLTERQRDILQFIRDFQKERGVTPTHREICDHFGFSSYGTVYKHLSLLQKKGLIKRDWNQKRGVEVVEQAAKPDAAVSAGVLELPLFGYIAAGQPLAVEISDETITVPERLTSRGENYVLKVRARTTADLEDLLRRIREKAEVQTRTTVVLSTSFEHRPTRP